MQCVIAGGAREPGGGSQCVLPTVAPSHPLGAFVLLIPTTLGSKGLEFGFQRGMLLLRIQQVS